MFAAMNNPISAYQRVGVETGVEAADPHKLILMLYEGAMLAIADARRHMQDANVAARGEAISKAISIIDEGLRSSLDVKVGAPLAQNLSSLYEYMSSRLLFANTRNDPAALDEVRRLLAELKDAWAAIGKSKVSVAPAAPGQRQPGATPNREKA